MENNINVYGSRHWFTFWRRIKQLEPVDDKGHIIMDYSVHDAIEADLIKLSLLFAEILRKSLRKSSWTGLPSSVQINGV